MKINNIKIFFLTLALFIILAALFTGCNWFNASAKVEKQLDLAVKYLSESKYEEAVLTYQEVIKIDKKNVPAYKGLSVVYTLQEKPEQAEQALRDGMEQVAGSAALKLALAGLMADQSRVDQAESIYKEVIAQDNSCLPAYQAYARLLAGLNRKNDAVAILEKAASGNAGQYRISSLLAEQYVKTGSKDKALSAVSRSLTAEPNQAAAYKLLEDLYNGRWAELVSVGEQYILQGKPVPGTVIKLTGLYRFGKHGDMIKLYDQLAGDIKSSPKVRLLAAQAYIKLGQKDQGLSLGGDLKPADIKDPALLAEIAAFCLEAGDKAAARGLALRGIGLDDTVLDNYVVLSKSYQEEDKSQSDIWLAKYLLGSAYSVKDAKAQTESKKEQAAQVKEEKPAAVSETAKSQKFSVSDIYPYLPAQNYIIRQSLWCDFDSDGAEELAVITSNFEQPDPGNPKEDTRYMVFKNTGSSISTMAGGRSPGSLNAKCYTMKTGARNFLVIKDYYSGDGTMVTLALTMKDGVFQPVWKGSEFKDIDGNGVMEGIYYRDRFNPKDIDVFKWDESRQSFISNRGETTGFRLSD